MSPILKTDRISQTPDTQETHPTLPAFPADDTMMWDNEAGKYAPADSARRIDPVDPPKLKDLNAPAGKEFAERYKILFGCSVPRGYVRGSRPGAGSASIKPPKRDDSRGRDRRDGREDEHKRDRERKDERGREERSRGERREERRGGREERGRHRERDHDLERTREGEGGNG